jgi:hypothetical protein
MDCTAPKQTRKKYLHCPEPYLRTKKRAMVFQAEHLQFKSEQDLARLHAILGEACTIGVRSHRPKARDKTGQSLRVNDSFNVVATGDNNQPTLQLTFDGYSVDLSISYQLFVSSSLQSDSWCQGVERLLVFLKGAMLGWGVHNNLQAENSDSGVFQQDEHMLIGASFDHEGNSFTVVAIQEPAGIVRSVNDATGATLEVDYEFASLAIKIKLGI